MLDVMRDARGYDISGVGHFVKVAVDLGLRWRDGLDIGYDSGLIGVQGWHIDWWCWGR